MNQLNELINKYKKLFDYKNIDDAITILETIKRRKLSEKYHKPKYCRYK